MRHPKNLSRLPRHAAIIMDGNGRWAKRRGLPRLVGHMEGTAAARRTVEVFLERNIPCVTFYGFSTENWSRPKSEIDGLLRILAERLDEEVKFAQEKGIRVCHLGKFEGLPPKLQDMVKQALEATKNNTKMTVALAVNYGSRDEIVEATRRLILDCVPAQRIDEKLFTRYLYTASMPDPDLIIRTGGEMRLSNFLMWQAAYAELYFTPVLWPDFDEKEIDKALVAFSQRQRRFGGLTAG